MDTPEGSQQQATAGKNEWLRFADEISAAADKRERYLVKYGGKWPSANRQRQMGYIQAQRDCALTIRHMEERRADEAHTCDNG